MKTKRGALIVIFLLAALFWSLSLLLAGQIRALGQSVSVRWETGAGVSPAELLRQEEYARQDGAEDQPEATLWQESGVKQVSDGGDKSVDAALVTVFGDCGAVTARPLLSGSFPARSDVSSCAVSSGLAFALWGSTDVLGMPLMTDGRTRHVLGVFQEDESRLFLQSGGDSDAPLSNMQLAFPAGGSREEAESFLTRTNFGGGTILDLPLIAWAAEALAGIPAVVPALGILLRIIARGRRLRPYPALLAGFLPLALLLLAGVLLCMEPIDIPARLIPTKWSDTAFWTRLFSGLIQSLKAWFSASPSARDLELWPRVIALPMLAVISAFLVGTAAVRVKINSYNGLVFGCLGSMAALYLVSLLLSPLGAVEFDKPMYLLPGLWLCADFILYLHDKYIRGKEPEKPVLEAREPRLKEKVP